jgi:integrase
MSGSPRQSTDRDVTCHISRSASSLRQSSAAESRSSRAWIASWYEPTLSPPRQAPQTWTADEVARFLAATEATRLAALWRFYATTRMRRNEALALRWQDVDLDGASVAITDSKSGRGRAVALDPDTVAALRDLRRRTAAERLALGPAYADHDVVVFCREDGVGYAPNYVTRAFREACERAGMRRIRLHDLRHTWASLALAAGVNPKVVSERLGHATVAFTLDTYSHVLPGLQEDAAARVAALIAAS